jgi:proteasome assembly chaperone (PAC2) family protein
MAEIKFFEKPILHQPSLIIGLDGWPNAAGVATSVVSYLTNALCAERFAKIEPWDFYSLTSSRPLTSINQGIVEGFALPGIDLYYRKSEKGRDLIFMSGREPDLNWKSFADLVFKILTEYEGKRIYTIGGVNDYVPHTRKTKVTAVINQPELEDELSSGDIELVCYQGQASVYTILHVMAKEGIGVISLWGSAPFYIPRNPIVYYALLRRLVDLLGLDLDLIDMQTAAELTCERVNEQVKRDLELKELVAKLEVSYENAGMAQEETRNIVKDIEDWLKRQENAGE